MDEWNYFLDRSFGPAGSFAGIMLVIVGIILLPFYWTGAILLVLGAFLGFTVSGCEIHVERRLVRPYHRLFGLLKIGTWRKLDGFIGLRVVKTKRSYRTFSLSNRETETSQEDFRVVLEAGSPQSRLEVLKRKTKEAAFGEARKLELALNMPLLDHIP